MVKFKLTTRRKNLRVYEANFKYRNENVKFFVTIVHDHLPSSVLEKRWEIMSDVWGSQYALRHASTGLFKTKYTNTEEKAKEIAKNIMKRIEKTPEKYVK